MYYVYLLRSKKNYKFYIGYTTDIEKRLRSHNAGESTATKAGTPFELIYYEAFRSKKDALIREKKLKHYGQSLYRLKQRLKESITISQTMCGEESPGTIGQSTL